MNVTYMILGADGKQYGPVTLEQLKLWMREGRINRESQIWRSDLNNWQAAGQYPELAMAPMVAAPPSNLPAPKDLDSEKQVRVGASWFYWTAGLSLINSIIALSGGTMSFIFGLGITQVIDVVANKSASGSGIIAIALDVIVAGVFVAFGVLAGKRQTWAFMVGMALYALDGLLLVGAAVMAGAGGVWLSVAFHGYVLLRMFLGVRACMQLNGARRPATGAF